MVVYAKYIVSLLSLIAFLASYYFLFLAKPKENTKQMRLRIMEQVNNQVQNAKKIFSNAELDKLFYEIGIIRFLNSFRFLSIKWITIFIFTVLALNQFFNGQGSHWIALPIIFYSFFNVTKPYPLYFLFTNLKEIMQYKKNKEVFLLYSLIKNQIETYSNEEKGKQISIISMLEKLRPRFTYINKAIGKILNETDPKVGLDEFYQDIGTDEAKDLAQILKDCLDMDLLKARDIFSNRYKQFVVLREENFKRNLKKRNIIAYFTLMIPVTLIVLNAVLLYNIYSDDLIHFKISPGGE